MNMTHLFLCLVTLLLSGWWTSACEANPLGRSKRTPISQLINSDRLSNPCSVSRLDCTQNPTDYESLTMYTTLAKDKLATLQSVSSSTALCSGIELAVAIPMPSVTNDMTKLEKLKEIYKSLVYHTAYIQAIGSLQTRGSTILAKLDESIGSLQNVQCSMECLVELSDSERSSLVSSATSRDYPNSQNSSRDSMYTCLISTKAIEVLDLLLATTRSP
ncbi:hypothetical protein CHUAL_006720 [Chamberlinius hualienensis]